jgi:hypothetical protein
MKKISDKEQRIVAEILTQFMFTKNMDDVMDVWNKIFEEYDLYSDPYTATPCSRKEYADNNVRYQKELMIQRYGHCDGLE